MCVVKSSVTLLLIVVPLLASNFPTYLQKCKNDKHLNECFLKNAQAGISHILKGDANIGIPSFFATSVPGTINLSNKDLKFEIDNFVVSLSPDTSVIEARWDTQNKNIFIKFKLSKVTWNSGATLEGIFLGQNVTGHGVIKQIYENGWFSCYLEYDIAEVDGAKYIVVKDGKSEYLPEKVTYFYDQFTNGAKITEFINMNWKKFDEAFNPQISAMLAFPVSSLPFKAIFKITPIDQLFD